jgi:hypothetical protein
LRSASLGQVLLNHLGGEQGGIEHFFDQFTGPMTAWWTVLGSPELNAEVRRKLTVRSIRVDIARSPSRPRMTAICAFRPKTGVEGLCSPMGEQEGLELLKSKDRLRGI